MKDTVLTMAKIDGIGGVFIYSNNTKKLADWYINVLSLPLQALDDGSYYVELYYRSLMNSDKKLHTVFAIMPEKEKLATKRNQMMINYRVDNLEAFVEYLKSKQVTVDPIHEANDGEGIGKFTHLVDPEGNKIELWQPSTVI